MPRQGLSDLKVKLLKRRSMKRKTEHEESVRKVRQQLFVELKMPKGLKHSGSMIDVSTARYHEQLSTVESQRRESSVQPKIGMNISQAEERSRHLDIYSRSFHRASKHSREDALRRIKQA